MTVQINWCRPFLWHKICHIKNTHKILYFYPLTGMMFPRIRTFSSMVFNYLYEELFTRSWLVRIRLAGISTLFVKCIFIYHIASLKVVGGWRRGQFCDSGSGQGYCWGGNTGVEGVVELHATDRAHSSSPHRPLRFVYTRANPRRGARSLGSRCGARVRFSVSRRPYQRTESNSFACRRRRPKNSRATTWAKSRATGTGSRPPSGSLATTLWRAPNSWRASPKWLAFFCFFSRNFFPHQPPSRNCNPRECCSHATHGRMTVFFSNKLDEQIKIHQLFAIVPILYSESAYNVLWRYCERDDALT